MRSGAAEATSAGAVNDEALTEAEPHAQAQVDAQAQASADAPSDTPAPVEPTVELPADARSEQSVRGSGAIAQAVLWLAIGCIAIGLGQLPLAFRTWQRARALELAAARTNAPAASASTSALPNAAASAAAPPPTSPPSAFRAAMLADDPSIEVAGAVVGKRTCAQTLEALGLAPPEIASLDATLRAVRPLTSCDADDRIVLARRKNDHALRALEIETAPGAFVRVRAADLRAPGLTEVAVDAGSAGGLVVEKLELPVSHKRTAVALVVETELEAAVAAADLDASILDALDLALESRHDLPPLARGTIVRIVADSTYVDGQFDRWDELVALELRPPGVPRDAPVVQPGAPGPIRLYHLKDAADAKATHAQSGFWDGHAQQPLKGKWRMPLRFPRISSRFNPRRMHPVLHVVMPHNGCDFAAKPGTPVYAIGAGTVQFVGEAGPSGNLVTVAHEGGIESGYAHLSRFAPGIAAGTQVEARTLIGYVGTTGRSTGPHLHLSAKRNGAFIDPLSLKLDGFRVVPPSVRGSFNKRKLEADAALDAIELPDVVLAPAPAPAASASASEEAPSGEEAPK